jgi:hypothetical protein
MLCLSKADADRNDRKPRLALPDSDSEHQTSGHQVSHGLNGTARLGMMQPYFFPYVGYFSLIHATTHWIVFDTAQYMRRAWVNRNRVLSEGANSWNYLRVPILHAAREASICEIMIDQTQNWKEQLFRQLDVYRLRRAPYFHCVTQWLEKTLPECERCSSGRLSLLLVQLLKATCEFIGLPFRFQIFSQMQLNIPPEMSPGDWAFEVSRKLEFTTYVNAPGGRDLFNAAQFDQAGIRLRFVQPALTPYRQGRTPFIPGLSILDLLMWNSPEEVLNLVGQYSLQEAMAQSDLAA